MQRIYWFLLLLLACTSCVDKREPIAVSFYYWKTVFDLNNTEKETLSHNEVKRLYVRYFDVSLKNGEAFPIGSILFKNLPHAEIIPVIYIKNEVLLHPHTNVQQLAKHILDYVDQINKHHHITTQELQLDCDWSLKSKEKFFALIEALKEQRKLTYSATIRLHQVKYFQKTGVPPVDYGVLMYYNMGTIASNTLNSIYDKNIAKQYIRYLDIYPLRLNVALPIFSWGIQTRSGKVVDLVNRLKKEDLDKHAAFRKIDERNYEVLTDGLYFGKLFAGGDRVKLESVTADDLKDIAKDLHKNLKDSPSEVIFYDLDQTNVQHYEKDIFKKTTHYLQ